MSRILLALGALCIGSSFFWYITWQLPGLRQLRQHMRQIERRLPLASRGTSPYHQERRIMVAVFVVGSLLTLFGALLKQSL